MLTDYLQNLNTIYYHFKKKFQKDSQSTIITDLLQLFGLVVRTVMYLIYDDLLDYGYNVYC